VVVVLVVVILMVVIGWLSGGYRVVIGRFGGVVIGWVVIGVVIGWFGGVVIAVRAAA
jgi:hypothetical protein